MRTSRAPLVRLLAFPASLALLTLAACAHRPPNPWAPLDTAAREVAGGSPDATAHALAGFRAMLLDGDSARARDLFDAALSTDASEPWALWGQALLAVDHAHPERALAAALDLLEKAPGAHPLKAAAARLVLDLSGQARAFDEALRARAPAILDAPRAELGPDAAHLLRAALGNADRGLLDNGGRAAALSDMGVVTAATLMGPFSPWHRLSMTEPTPVEATGALDAAGKPLAGPYGPLAPRALHFADGRFTLSGEPPQGDVFVLAADVNVPDSATWVLRTVSSMDHVAVVDGTRVLTRLTWGRPAPTLSTQAIALTAGPHRLVVRMARGTQGGHLLVALQRLDGKPAKLAFAPARGPAPRWAGVELVSAEGLYASAAAAQAALAPVAGDALSRYVAARDGLGRDPDGAAALVAGLPADLTAPAMALLRADVALGDRSIPSRVARGRAHRELEAALGGDHALVRAQLVTASLALDDGRPLDALEAVKQARAMDPAPGAPVLALEARVELALGLDSGAAATAAKADAAVPGYCDAVLLQYDVARRRDAITESDALLARTTHCSGYLARAAEHLRSRGRIEAAQKAYAALLEEDETQAPAGIALSGLLAARQRYGEAVAVLDRLKALWPRDAAVFRALGDVEEQAGHPAQALAAREAALGLEGGDLALRRQVERAKTGKELLADEAVSAEEAIASYESAPGSEDATSAYVLDFAAIEAFPDGSMVDRIHIIQKALDQQGVQDVAEVQIPQDAVVLALRTLKPDGRRLEPESIEGKDAISLPGVQVGDLVEYEYLEAHPSRGPGQPGFTAANFYFRIARQPNARSTYIVKAPKGAGLKVDAHNVEAPAPKVEGDHEVFRHEERRVPPYIPEPGSPPSVNEWLPFVSVGAGQEGNGGVLRSYADAYLANGAVTAEVERFARGAAAAVPSGVEQVKAVYAAVMEKLSGRDAGLPVSAAASVALDRGSRTWLLYASLRALGYDARLAAVRTFTADPAPYRFPAEGLLNYVCVYLTLPGSGVLWLDPLVRYAPFGELPELATGGREAWLLPEPGHPAERVSTPPTRHDVTKQVRLTMRLGEDGQLAGDGVETYSGFEAAQLGEALESLSEDQRDQALQSALSRYFGGADLSGLKVDAQRRVGGTVSVSYHFVASRFARVDGGELVAGALTFPHLLGRRYLATPTRTTPLFIDSSETSHVVATLALPAGWRLVDPLEKVDRDGPSAHYARTESQVGDALTVTEDFRLAQSRIAPAQYEAFAQFAGEVDLLQGREVVFRKGAEPSAAP